MGYNECIEKRWNVKMKMANMEREHMIQQDNLRSMEENLSSNVDLLKRISNLEKEVYKNK